MVPSLIASALAVLVYMTGIFLLALRRKDNSIVDIGWGLGFVLVALLMLLRSGTLSVRHLLVAALVTVWGLRLSIHLYFRKRGQGEDFRYAQWRRSWGRWFVLRSYFQVFILQGVFLMVIALPIILVIRSAAGPFTAWDAAGFLVWVLGFVFETAGDAQMERFRADPANKGRIITSGLWRFTRHPNYFGEAAMWWGIFLIGLAVPRGWLGVASPLLITFLLVKVSGVPMLEKKYAGNPEFAAYARRTSVFIPWFPKRAEGETPRPDLPR
jgi:steroid 5-alpha reductase family enzyme